jgi:hypothetical protein
MQNFKNLGWTAADAAGGLDMFVYIADAAECGRTAYNELLREYENTAVTLLESAAAALPRMEKGKTKRFCFVNKLSSSINWGPGMGSYEALVLAACNMAVKVLFNRLRPEGYTFRLYGLRDYGDLDECSYIADYCIRNRSPGDGDHQRSDEDRLVIRDKFEKEYPW